MTRHPDLHPRRRGLALALLAGTALSALAGPAFAACGDLAGASIPGEGSITAATAVPAGSFAAPDGTTYPNLPAFCRVEATLTPTPDSNIRIEVWLPEGSAWNGRFLGTGNGGYGGAIRYDELAGGTQLGFATANQDAGTAPSTSGNAKALIGRPEKWNDFGTRAAHLMTVAGKAVTQQYYTAPPSRAYFSGCSFGGQQAFNEAEKFPDDYDGILAGAPANNRTHLQMAGVWNFQATRLDPATTIEPEKAPLITQSVLQACVTQSGGLPTDTYLTDPRACRWDPGALQCAEDASDTSQCLTPPQVDALRKVYDGPRNPRTGALLYPGISRGSESGSTFDLPFNEGVGRAAIDEPQFPGLFYWVFGPNWDWRGFDFDRDPPLVDDVLAPVINANTADLSAFRDHGGKLLGFHGFADPLVPPQEQVNYYLRVTARGAGLDPAAPAADISAVQGDHAALARTQEFYRLFMVPGMGHCGGGPGPNQFFNATISPVPADPQHNALLALQRWVEQGQAPTSIIATKYVNDQPAQGVAATRPLCAFPRVSRYSGQGDPNDSASFACARGGDYEAPIAAPEYRR
ncbi:tannase/feruloyl esterase family alpha/beta hydrolase [Paracraurococcus lichenis]|uniref:Tannase/feruloyl esterase family alpha/beta hydrolase n=1 Tax=Paracraurococcus lichenis TaxID=3064888 RepID=A0ABT9E8I0_9PROT|nr:tannase/feruloyl esterase family alpha/beta hydrolase [Paracraurococcus sp. LOR1-02]MDO9712283.1 tannase/feruloyl esterase family alpha/beta hydrolase [Paracraurococcus sp. LOR1-02]